jgi:hypothetical protein
LVPSGIGGRSTAGGWSDQPDHPSADDGGAATAMVSGDYEKEFK